jgi:hypothetical protein
VTTKWSEIKRLKGAPTERRRYHVRAERDAQFWMFRVLELEVAGQSTTRETIEADARELIALMLHVDPRMFDLDVEVVAS